MGRNVSSLPGESTISHSALSQGGWSRNLSPRVSLRSLVQSLQNSHRVVRVGKTLLFKDDTSICHAAMMKVLFQTDLSSGTFLSLIYKFVSINTKWGEFSQKHNYKYRVAQKNVYTLYSSISLE